MVVRTLTLTDFRNYTNAACTFAEGVNVICGDNAQGKTNLLEAVYLFSTAKSFRTQSDGNMIKFGAESARVRMEYTAFGRENTCEITLKNGKRKLILLNGVPLAKTSELLGQIPAVVFSPDELHIISGAPEVRRRFIDSAISSRKPAYYGALHNYLKIVKQKNNLLKHIQNKETLFVWNEQLANEGAKLMQYRKAFFEALSPVAAQYYGTVAAGKEALEVRYAPSVPLAETREQQRELLLASLQKRADAELLYKSALVGPHRDDMQFVIDEHPAQLYASQGQQRTAAVVLKIAQAALLEAATGEKPVILLDDVMSELDATRRGFLTESVGGNQVLITCTDRESVSLHGEKKYFFVREGTVCMST